MPGSEHVAKKRKIGIPSLLELGKSKEAKEDADETFGTDNPTPKKVKKQKDKKRKDKKPLKDSPNSNTPCLEMKFPCIEQDKIALRQELQSTYSAFVTRQAAEDPNHQLHSLCRTICASWKKGAGVVANK